MLSLKKTPAPVITPRRRSSQMGSPFVCEGYEKEPRMPLEKTYEVIHVCYTQHENAGIVGPLNMVQLAAIQSVVGSIEELICRAHQAHCSSPIVHSIRPISISGVACVNCQPSCHVEEATIGNGVFVVVAGVEAEDLPFQSTSTRRGVPSNGLRVEDCLCKCKPLRLGCGWIWISILRS